MSRLDASTWIQNKTDSINWIGFPRVITSQLASSVDEMQKLAARDQLGQVKDGQMGWPEWSLAMKQCYEVMQQVSLYSPNPRTKEEDPQMKKTTMHTQIFVYSKRKGICMDIEKASRYLSLVVYMIMHDGYCWCGAPSVLSDLVETKQADLKFPLFFHTAARWDHLCAKWLASRSHQSKRLYQYQSQLVQLDQHCQYVPFDVWRGGKCRRSLKRCKGDDEKSAPKRMATRVDRYCSASAGDKFRLGMAGILANGRIQSRLSALSGESCLGKALLFPFFLYTKSWHIQIFQAPSSPINTICRRPASTLHRGLYKSSRLRISAWEDKECLSEYCAIIADRIDDNLCDNGAQARSMIVNLWGGNICRFPLSTRADQVRILLFVSNIYQSMKIQGKETRRESSTSGSDCLGKKFVRTTIEDILLVLFLDVFPRSW